MQFFPDEPRVHKMALSTISVAVSHGKTTLTILVYSPDFAGTHCAYQWRNGPAELN